MNKIIENKKILKANELTKIFPHPSKDDTNIPLFANASFEMTSDQPNFIIGVSGSGKTTLFRIISSLESINAGEIFLNELAIHHLKGRNKTKYLSSLGFIDQFPAKYLSLLLTVKQNMDYNLILYSSLQKEEREKRILETARNFEILHLLERKAIHLSGGEMRRLSLACNMIYNPSLILCDEPTSQLDDKTKELIMQSIYKMNELYDALIIIATHDMSIIGKNPTFKIVERRIEKWQ